MQKSDIHHDITQRRDDLESAQKKAQSAIGITLQKMVINRLSFDDVKSAHISEMRGLFVDDYPKISIEDVLVPLIVSRQVEVDGDTVKYVGGGEHLAE